MKGIILLLLALFISLQYKLWLGEGGLLTLKKLKAEQQIILAKNQQLRDRNQSLASEVTSLKQQKSAIQERARNDLGMIQSGEVFYRFIEQPDSPSISKQK